MKRFVLAALALAAMISGARAEGDSHPEWSRPVAPFHIIGNIYYVGTEDIAIFLIVTPKGDILIDGGLAKTVPLIERNIATLGFKLSDVKIMLNSHAHFDHAAGLAQIKRDSGAMLYASTGDAPILERGFITFGPSANAPFPPVKVDAIVRDGEQVSIGGAVLTAHLTPGHTPGCTSWTMPVSENGAAHTAIFYCSTSVAGNPLVNNTEYPQIVSDYRSSFAKLRAIKADVFLGPHALFFDPQKKLAAAWPGGPNPFVDPGELQRFVNASERHFNADLAAQQAAAH
jgi:metallo-beta-lactamase class B